MIAKTTAHSSPKDDTAHAAESPALVTLGVSRQIAMVEINVKIDVGDRRRVGRGNERGSGHAR